MIIHPDFPEHWKTRLLVEITGDESSPMAVIRLWAHCQSNRRWNFPDMTPAQLASICRWGSRKPPCHVALVRAGYVDKLSPGGFAAHEWGEHNGQLLQKWRAGEKGGRKPHSENPNDSAISQEPTDNRPITVRVQDQTRSDQIRIAQPSPDASPLRTSSASSDGNGGMGMAELEVGSGGVGLGGLVAELANKMTPGTHPTLQEVRTYLEMAFNGAAEFAESFYNAMEKQHWCDKDRKPITKWQAMAKSYASTAWAKKQQRGQRPNRNAGTYNEGREHEYSKAVKRVAS